MKLIVQIPAYNEEGTISEVIKNVPKRIKKISKVKVLVYDDGSTDKTLENAKKSKADYLYHNNKNLGLATTFQKALNTSLEKGADIIVNIDADNQYDPKEIPKLIKPIIENKANLVTGDRQIKKIKHMSKTKRIGNIIGSWIIRVLTGTKISDASCGFRAYSRGCAERLNLISEHTYTHETLIQAAFQNMIIDEVPITFKKRRRGKSKLIRNVPTHIIKSVLTIIRSIILYKSFKSFINFGFFIIFIGILGILRFVYFYLIGQGAGHIQSIIISSILIGIGFNAVVISVIADLISINRRLLEKLQK